jgi:hypothetical protein
MGTFTYEASLGESARHRRGCVTGDPLESLPDDVVKLVHR